MMDPNEYTESKCEGPDGHRLPKPVDMYVKLKGDVVFAMQCRFGGMTGKCSANWQESDASLRCKYGSFHPDLVDGMCDGPNNSRKLPDPISLYLKTVEGAVRTVICRYLNMAGKCTVGSERLKEPVRCRYVRKSFPEK